MDTPAPGASVLIVENPHTDPITVAYSALDAAKARQADGADEVARLTDKAAKLKAQADDASAAIDTAKAAAAIRDADVVAAQKAVDALAKDDPALADTVAARRAQERWDRIRDLSNELARLQEGN